MEDKEAKIPEDMNQWEGIDIYLFTNGQQFSPPRKYHLESQELASWRLLLNYLARAHYGYMHSHIDLYTLEGEKVSGPLGLSHGLSYVAVEPNETFINAGYKQYLMKASRSRLKRYGHEDTQKSDDTGESKKLSRISTNVDNLRELCLKTKDNADQKNHEISDKVQENAKVLKAYGQTRNNFTPIKSIPNRRQYTVHRNSVSRKTKPSAVPSQKNIFLKKHDSSSKEMLKFVNAMSKRASTKPVNYRKTQVNKINPTCKALVRGKDLSPTFEIPVKFDKFVKRRDSSSFKLLDSNHKHITDNISEVKENQIKESTISLNDTVAVLNKNMEADTTGTNIVDSLLNDYETALKAQDTESFTPVYVPYDKLYTIDNVDNHTMNSEMPLPLINNRPNIYPSKLSIVTKDISHSNSKIQINNTIAPKSIEDICNKSTTNSLIAFVDHEHTIKLKISIEVKNHPDTLAVDSRVYNDNNQNSLSEKESCVNFNHMHVPLQTFINESYRTDRKPVSRIPVNTCKMHRVSAFIKNDDKEPEIIPKLSHFQHKTNKAGCFCEESIIKVDKHTQTSKMKEDTVLDHVCDIFPKEAVPIMTIKVVENAVMKENMTPTSKGCACLDFNVTEKETPRKNTENTEFLLTKYHLNTPLKVLLNKYTQTDTHNLLLEARHHEDSHYSFHLPPLHLLKHYNLQ